MCVIIFGTRFRVLFYFLLKYPTFGGGKRKNGLI